LLAEINHHPRDRRVVFFPDEHRYEVDGVVFQSVTSLIKRFFPVFDADAAIAKLSKKHPLHGRPPEEIKARWAREGETASAAGTEMHRQIELFLNTGQLGDHPDFAVFHESYTASRRGEPYRTEWIVFDEETGIAGTIDYLYRRGDRFCMTDWKRSKQIKLENRFQRPLPPLTHLQACNFHQYALQQNIYRLILKKHYDIRVDRMSLAQIHSGKLTPWPVPLMEREAERIMALNRQLAAEEASRRPS
jgi:ATP-dependent exoDNAse (exonuclease V) beta subunit